MFEPPKTVEGAKALLYEDGNVGWNSAMCAFSVYDKKLGYSRQCMFYAHAGPEKLYCARHAIMIKKAEAREGLQLQKFYRVDFDQNGDPSVSELELIRSSDRYVWIRSAGDPHSARRVKKLDFYEGVREDKFSILEKEISKLVDRLERLKSISDFAQKKLDALIELMNRESGG